MKKFLYLLLALAATGCSSDELTTDKSEQPLPGEDGGEVKMYTVSLDMKSFDGDLDISQEPLTKAGETNNLWWFQIYSTPAAGGNSTPYAYGVFDKQENMTVKLAEGYTYYISASLIKDGKDKVFARGDTLYGYPITDHDPYPYQNDKYLCKITNGFVLTTDKTVYPSKTAVCMKDNTGSYYLLDCPFIDRYYGVVKGYVPVANGKIAINMYRMQMGYRVEVQPFESGSVVVNFLDWKDTIPAATTQKIIERDMQYAYSWGTIDNYGQDTTAYAQEQINNMAESVTLKVDWISPDGSRITNIFNDYVTMQRLKRSVFKISLKQVEAHDSGVETKTEATVVTDGEAVNIEGNINEGQDTEITPGS